MEERVYNPSYFEMGELKEKCGVYQIRNLANGKLYIGSTNNLKYRAETHFKRLKRNSHENPHLQLAYNKYGKDSFIFEVIEICDISSQYVIEQYWLDKFFGDKCYNINPIAEKPPSGLGNKEAHKKISVSLKKYYSNYENRKKSANSRIGHKVSEETRRKLSIANKGKRPSNKCIEAARLYNKTHKMSMETRQKISAAGIGRRHTEDSKNKMRKRVICVETQQIFNSVGAAGLFAGVHYTSISKCCGRDNRTAGGYHFKYID